MNWQELAALGYKKGVRIVDLRAGNGSRRGVILDPISDKTIAVVWQTGLRENESDHELVNLTDIQLYRLYMIQQQGAAQ